MKKKKAILRTDIKTPFFDYKIGELVTIIVEEDKAVLVAMFSNPVLQPDDYEIIEQKVHFTYTSANGNENEFKGTVKEFQNFMQSKPNIMSIKNLTANIINNE